MGYQEDAAAVAARYGIDPGRFVAQINAESGFNPGAVSPAGCKGIAQICDSVPFDPFDPAASLDYAARRMASALHTYGGDWALALGSYNCGPKCADNVAAGKQNWPTETVNYIQKILGGSGDSAIGSSEAGGSNSSGLPIANMFSPAALQAGSSTYIIFFAAIVLLLGVYALSRGAKGASA